MLRRLAAGEAVDWAHVIEEVADVRLSELRACRSLLRRAVVHLLKLRAWPGSSAAAHRRGQDDLLAGDAGGLVARMDDERSRQTQALPVQTPRRIS